MLEELPHTAKVESVAARELHCFFARELTSVADSAQLIIMLTCFILLLGVCHVFHRGVFIVEAPLNSCLVHCGKQSRNLGAALLLSLLTLFSWKFHC